MMSGHDANSIFFNKKNKDWTSRKLAFPLTPLRPITSRFFIIPPLILKVDVIYIIPNLNLISQGCLVSFLVVDLLDDYYNLNISYRKGPSCHVSYSCYIFCS